MWNRSWTWPIWASNEYQMSNEETKQTGAKSSGGKARGGADAAGWECSQANHVPQQHELAEPLGYV